MKLIQSKAELLTQEQGLPGIYKMIELAGRTCYKSEANITADSAAEFVGRMIKSGHTAMLEHGTVYLLIKWWQLFKFLKYLLNPYSRVHRFRYITTNYRVLVEHHWFKDLKYRCEPVKYHEKRYTIKFTTDRGVSHELVRHRVFSFAQESTRYCNYSQDKFDNEITFIIPSWYNPIIGPIFKKYLSSCENMYIDMISSIGADKRAYSPQQARQVLPNALKTEIVVTGFISDWKHFFDLRYFGTTGKPHPDMLELTTKAKAVLEEAGLWRLIESERKNQHEN